ncbi:Signal transduction histidine Kinases (STHK) [Magnetospirillum sp. XM-1]|uniref:chemotaxis protein CheA n=1 Tax=Magnetospirillum sp. XM-1 TaxID=1663591 RepID=UPI00073DFB8C|nr:chemotaxis protein CheA [Magnetospirillum sp. XM-1]CUW39572.1 Signal transduction histidine Kinases (STHK) [Magnetospirillum sp. XM-1]
MTPGAPDPAETFRQEAQDLLIQLEDVLLDLDGNPGDRELIDTAFRALHTLKGSGAMFGFDDLARFAHTVENTFDRLRRTGAEPSRELIAVALSAKDFMRQLIQSPGEAEAAIGDGLVQDLLRHGPPASLPETTGPCAAAPRPAEPKAAPVLYDIVFALPPDALLRGTNPLRLLDELRDMGECTVAADLGPVPAIDDLDPERSYLKWRVRLATSQPRSAIDEVFMFVLDDMELSVTTMAPEAAASPPEPHPAAEAHPAGEPVSNRGMAKRDPAGNGIRIPAERIDNLMDRVGELVIAQSRLRQLAQGSLDSTLRSVSEDIERLSSELRVTTMGIRMVPIGQLFARFRRVVHDLSRELGKDVQLETSGEETELDKTVIESLNDPLVHLIRNAIDHGLETAAEREAAGKPRAGTLSLEARHAGAQVLITIRDDGRGMNRQRIRAKAVEAGWLSDMGDVPDAELFQMIFRPGFSTAATVTNVSGRGVGMDVVKRTIDALHGFIDVSSPPGRGAQVTLRLPLTLAIIDGLLVRVGGGRYVLPLSTVEECVELSEADNQRSTGRSFLNIRDELVPFLRLRDLFKVQGPADPYPKVVIVTAGDQRVGLVVDQIIGDHQTVIKSLSKLHADVAAFSGATILGDGTVALILDVVNLIAAGRIQEMRLKAS